MKQFNRTAFLFILFIALSFSQSKSEKIDQFVNKYREFGLFNGSVLVAEQGNVIFKKGYGFADMEWEIKNTPDTKFRLGSITKQFTGMLIMQQVADGKIKLENKITDFISDYPNSTSNITVHQLLTHTAGVPSYTGFPDFFKETSRDPYTPEDFMKTFWDKPLDFEPGTQFRYSNSGYFLLGIILEKVSGKTYEELLDERILHPLNMKNTGYDLHKPLLKKRAAGYEKRGNSYINAAYLDMSLPYSAGSMYSTVEDLYKWDQALYSHALLSKELTETMFTPDQNNYAYGWFISEETLSNDKKIKVLGHGGGINGFNTNISRVVSEKHLIVLLNNTGSAPLNPISIGITNILEGLEATEPSKPLVTFIDKSNTVKELFALLEKLKGEQPDVLKQRDMNTLGYSYLSEKRYEHALVVFKMNIGLYPKAVNTYDSYAEGFLESGDKPNAIKWYKKALEVDPYFESSKKALIRLGEKVEDAVRKEIDLSENILQTYVGTYEIQPGFNLAVTLEDGKLMTQATGQQKVQVFAESEMKFFLKVMNAQLQFNKNDKNEVVGLTLFQAGREMPAKRL